MSSSISAQQQLFHIIDIFESGKSCDATTVIQAYDRLAELYDDDGDALQADGARKKASTILAANPMQREQFYIDQMEEYDDIDTEALSLAYNRLAEACFAAGNSVLGKDAQVRAESLMALFVKNGCSRRSTPRSTLNSSRVAQVVEEKTQKQDSKASELLPHSLTHGEPVAEAKSNATQSSPSKNENFAKEYYVADTKDVPPSPIRAVSPARRIIRHDSMTSPIVRQRSPNVVSFRSDLDASADAKEITEDSLKLAASKETVHFADGLNSSSITASSSARTKTLRFEDMKVEWNPDAEDLDVDTVREQSQSKAVDSSIGPESDDNVYANDDFALDPEGKETDAKAVASSCVTSVVQGSVAVMDSSLIKASKSKQPVLFITWDGEASSAVNVDKLKRFLKSKGYIVFEHSGGDVTGSQSHIRGFNATNVLASSSSTDSLHGDSSVINTTDSGLNSGSISGPSMVSQADSAQPAQGSFAASARAKVSQMLVDQMTISTVFVACVTRAFTKNLNCKKLTLRMRELQGEMLSLKKKGAEMLYVMLNGDFTTESQPYHCRSGWLGYLLKDSLWSPAWSHAHIAGAAEAIASTVNLRRNVVRLNPQHVLYIETRGKKGICPPCQIG